MGSEDGGPQPPFSPIGIRHASVVQDDTSGNVSEPERVIYVSSASVPPKLVLNLWKEVARVYDTQKQGMCIIVLILGAGFHHRVFFF